MSSTSFCCLAIVFSSCAFSSLATVSFCRAKKICWLGMERTYIEYIWSPTRCAVHKQPPPLSLARNRKTDLHIRTYTHTPTGKRRCTHMHVSTPTHLKKQVYCFVTQPPVCANHGVQGMRPEQTNGPQLPFLRLVFGPILVANARIRNTGRAERARPIWSSKSIHVTLTRLEMELCYCSRKMSATYQLQRHALLPQQICVVLFTCVFVLPPLHQHSIRDLNFLRDFILWPVFRVNIVVGHIR